MSLPGLAAAQTKTGSPADAERLGKEGERLLSQHDAASAVEPLAKAYALSQNPKYLLPLGLAYAEAERPLDALDALGRFLKDAQAVPDAKRREIGSKLAVMLDQVAATVTIEATRHNATVKLDDRVIGKTPLSAPLRLMPGKHSIVMQPAPTDPSSGAQIQLEIRPGEHKTVTLEPGLASKFLEPQARLGGRQAPSGASNLSGTGATSEATPVYQKWWFWTAIGGGAAGLMAVALGAGLGSRGDGGGSAEFPGVATWQGGQIDARPPMMALVGSLR